MKIKIIAVGQKMPNWVESGINDFEQRIHPQQSFQLVQVPMATRGKNSDVERYKSKESDEINRHIKTTDLVLVLDERGRHFSTGDLSNDIKKWRLEAQDVVFIIGGPDGLADDFKNNKFKIFALSQLTLPHPIARLILVEQIYRALSIIANHPYHRV